MSNGVKASATEAKDKLMPDGPYATPDEERLMRMLRSAGTPEEAGLHLLTRLEALEAAVAELEARGETEAEPAPAEEEAG